MQEDPQQIGLTIKTLSHLLYRCMGNVLKLEQNSSHSVVQTHILGYFARRQITNISQSELQQHFGIRRSSMANVLKKMEEDGLIIREEAREDKRQKQVFLTDLAKQKCMEQLALVQDFEVTLAQGLDEESLQQFFATANQIKRNLETTVCLENYENK
ncbi:MAG: MarR family winged helix-turn-helix transcriptional regulator [Sphaerochaetaceae bacterium]